MQEVFEKIIKKLYELNRPENISDKSEPPKSAYDYQTGVIDSMETVKQFAAEYNNG